MTDNTRWAASMVAICMAWIGCALDGHTASDSKPNAATDGDAATSGAAGSDSQKPAQVAGPKWTTLLEESWTLPAGGEVAQWCADMVVAEDTYVSAIRPVHPRGTHHTTLSVTADKTPCSSAAVFANGIIYAAGVGTEALQMPEGVAFKLPAGYVLHLGLHLYNTSDEELSGVSGIEIVRADPKDVKHEAELLVAGPLSLNIPPGRSTMSGRCTITEDQTLFALFPHMHQLGVHLKTTLTLDGQPKVLHDDEYVFTEQYQLLIDPLDLHVGDSVTTDCTYDNPTNRNVKFGESSDTEMCFSVLFRYPATGHTFCSN
jgi:hypothetical protein